MKKATIVTMVAALLMSLSLQVTATEKKVELPRRASTTAQTILTVLFGRNTVGGGNQFPP
jgi:hypothetical protein